MVFKCHDLWRLRFPSEYDCHQAYSRLLKSVKQTFGPLCKCNALFTFVELLDAMYAFYLPTELGVSETNERWQWKYSCMAFMQRMNMDVERWRIAHVNEGFPLSVSIPDQLIVPASIEDSVLQASAAFRSSGRLPHVVYHHPTSHAVLVRCSEPLQGAKLKRNMDDERLVQSILQTTSTQSSPVVVDTRSKAAAFLSRTRGGGTEAESSYSNVRVFFANIDDDGVTRQAYQRLLEVTRNTQTTASTYLNEIVPWMKQVQACLRPAIYMANTIACDGHSCMVHGDEDSEVTSVLVSLTKIMLDPYYRSLDGLLSLVEEDWIHEGHPFGESLLSDGQKSGGLSGSNTLSRQPTAPLDTITNSLAALSSTLETVAASLDVKQQSQTSSAGSSVIAPAFVLFMECMHQIMNQFPLEFEYNFQAILYIFQHSLSCQFGQFLFKTPKERAQENVCQKTLSLWDHIKTHHSLFLNGAYRYDRTRPDPNLPPLPVSVNSKRLALSRGMYDCWDTLAPFSEFQRFKFALPINIPEDMDLKKVYHELSVPCHSFEVSDGVQVVYAASTHHAMVRCMKLEIEALANALVGGEEDPVVDINLQKSPPDVHAAIKAECECGPLCVCKS